MIKVHKSEETPARLLEVGYTCDEVKQVILDDQKDKCYLCERKVTTDYQVEHLASRTHHEEMENEWKNLFIACNYCNDRKKHFYDDIPLPNEVAFEDEISQIIDLKAQKAEFVLANGGEQLEKLVELLDKLYNGKSVCRNLMESRFWKDFMKSYALFLRRAATYKLQPTEENKQLMIAELSIEQPALGFKYSFLKKDQEMWNTFKEYCVWNK